jgi:hypothetical protein
MNQFQTHYLLAPALAVPQLVLDTGMDQGTPYGAHLVFSVTPAMDEAITAGSILVDWSMPVLADGDEPMSDEVLTLSVGRVMAAGGTVMLSNSECHRLLKMPHWLIFTQAAENKDQLEVAALEALGINIDKRKSLATLNSETYAILMMALS